MFAFEDPQSGNEKTPRCWSGGTERASHFEEKLLYFVGVKYTERIPIPSLCRGRFDAHDIMKNFIRLDGCEAYRH